METNGFSGAVASSLSERSNSVILINSVDELQALRRRRAMPARFSLAIEIPGLSQTAARAASERLVSFAQECGCSLGAKCMAAGFVAMLLYLIWSQGIASAGLVWRLPLTLVAALLGATAGKFAGLARAHRSLNREIDRLLATRSSLETSGDGHA